MGAWYFGKQAQTRTGLGKSHPPTFYPRLRFWVSPLPPQKEQWVLPWKYSKTETLINYNGCPQPGPTPVAFRGDELNDIAELLPAGQFVTYGLLNGNENPYFRTLQAACKFIHKAALNISNSWNQSLPHSALEFLITKYWQAFRSAKEPSWLWGWKSLFEGPDRL